MDEAQARARVKELKAWRSHFAAYVAVNLFLFALNMIEDAGDIWFIYPLLGWGIGMAIHTFKTFWTGRDWEERKVEELTGLRQTQDELQRLSERTDALVQILSAVNWDQIDPQLLDTRDRLEIAQRRLSALKQRDDADSREEVRREIEKLEEFVTSSRFRYYELASRAPE